MQEINLRHLDQLHRQGNAAEQLHGIRGGVYIRDVVFSANDGLVTTFAVAAGAAGAALSPSVVIVLGLANMFADGLAMALGNYLGTKSRLDFEKANRKIEETEVETIPEREREEVENIARKRGIPAPRITEWVTTMTATKKTWVDEMLVWELGIIPGESGHSVKSAVATFVAFIAAGFLPLTPYVFRIGADLFNTSIVVTVLSLFAIGALRTFVTKRNWLRSGIEMLLVGGIAAIAAYVIGAVVGR